MLLTPISGVIFQQAGRKMAADFTRRKIAKEDDDDDDDDDEDGEEDAKGKREGVGRVKRLAA